MRDIAQRHQMTNREIGRHPNGCAIGPVKPIDAASMGAMVLNSKGFIAKTACRMTRLVSWRMPFEADLSRACRGGQRSIELVSFKLQIKPACTSPDHPSSGLDEDRTIRSQDAAHRRRSAAWTFSLMNHYRACESAPWLRFLDDKRDIEGFGTPVSHADVMARGHERGNFRKRCRCSSLTLGPAGQSCAEQQQPDRRIALNVIVHGGWTALRRFRSLPNRSVFFGLRRLRSDTV